MGLRGVSRGAAQTLVKLCGVSRRAATISLAPRNWRLEDGFIPEHGSKRDHKEYLGEPGRQSIRGIKPKRFPERFKFVPRQGFCKPIGHLVSSGHTIELHIAVYHCFPHIAVLNGDVFGSGVVPRVFCKGYRPLVIAADGDRLGACLGVGTGAGISLRVNFIKQLA